MAFTTITNADLRDKGVTGLPDTPNMEASELKARFDSLGNLTVQKLRTLVTELEAETASISLGASVPAGLSAAKNVQAIINALYVIINQNKQARHTHSNYATLNAITSDVKSRYDAKTLMLDSITSVQQTVHDSDSEIPTSGAVVDYVNARIAQALGR